MLLCFRQILKWLLILSALLLIIINFAIQKAGLGREGSNSGLTVAPGPQEAPMSWASQNVKTRRKEGEEENILQLLTKRYWILMQRNLSISEGSPGSTQPQENVFTTTRLAQTSMFNLLRPRPGPGISVLKNDDRILAQLVLGMEGLPSTYTQLMKPKTILMLQTDNNLGPRDLDLETDPLCSQFKLNSCRMIRASNKRDTELVQLMQQADAIITTHGGTIDRTQAGLAIPSTTKFIYFMMESPYVASTRLASVHDWLDSYWRHSDIVSPYAKWVYYDPSIRTREQETIYATLKVNSTGKRGIAAIFVSNCNAANGRIEFVQQLQKYVAVDVYGHCGKLKCPRTMANSCFDLLQKEYKFYLAFENANCRDYITEKLFVNALQNNVVPVVMGAHPDDYRTLAPEGSYIHVEDFDSVRELAEYLLYLDRNDEEYNSYFAWKGTGDFIDTKHYCRVCAMMHYSDYIASLDQPSDSNFVESDRLVWNERSQCGPTGHWYWNKTHENS